MTHASELCSDCGICCDGALFGSVELEGPGLVVAREHRLPMVETADGHKLELPCPVLKGVLCGIYDERPECCAEYFCELLLRVEEHGLSLDEAREIIHKTRTVRSRVTAAVGATPWWLALRSASEAQRADPRWADDNAELLAKLKALEKLIQRHFWG